MEEELEKFKEFKASYNFEQKQIYEKEGIKYCDGVALIDEDGKEIGESEKWINVGYNLKGAYSKVLSKVCNFREYLKQRIS